MPAFMGDSPHGQFPPPVQDSARGKSKVEVFANVLTHRAGSVLNTPNALPLD